MDRCTAKRACGLAKDTGNVRLYVQQLSPSLQYVAEAGVYFLCYATNGRQLV